MLHVWHSVCFCVYAVVLSLYLGPTCSFQLLYLINNTLFWGLPVSHGLLPQYGIFSLGFSCLHSDFPSHSYCKWLNILNINYELFFFSKSLPLRILYFLFLFLYILHILGTILPFMFLSFATWRIIFPCICIRGY